MKVLVTGAHFTPAQAVIEELLKIDDIKITYVGRSSTQEGFSGQSLEQQELKKDRVKFVPLIAGRFNRFLSFGTIISLVKVPIGFIQAFYLVLRESPDVILSFGGYIGAPVVFAGWWFSVPIIIHEQTRIAGLSNRFSSLFANKILVSFDTNYPYPKSKTIITGNPIRSEIKNPISISSDLENFVKLAKKENKKLIYITGGNQGSHLINETIVGILPKLTGQFFIIHQTGDSKFKDFDMLTIQKESLKNKERYFISKTFSASDVGFILKNSDLVVSRSGANSLSEFDYFNLPAVLIPLPFIYQNEQYKNALFYQKSQIAEVLSQSKLNKDSLIEAILNISKKEKTNSKKEEFFLFSSDGDKLITLQVLLTLQQEDL